ncbi:MAG: GNAT family N-acetyltransferase [Bryobacteraceae bacterium]
MLRNLFEHYLHDMSEWFDVDVNAHGSYSFDAASIWADGYDAYLAKDGESLVGFALVGPATEWLPDEDAHDMHEFFVLRRFRRTGCGQKMAELIWDQYPGNWLVRVLDANVTAVPFWRSTVSSQSGGSHTEETRDVNGRPWRFFQFVSEPEAGE